MSIILSCLNFFDKAVFHFFCSCLPQFLFLSFTFCSFLHLSFSNFLTFVFLFTIFFFYFFLLPSIFHHCFSSSLSCRAGSTDIPDPLSPLFPIVHRLWLVFWTTSRILTKLLNVCSCWSSCFCSAICGGP